MTYGDNCVEHDLPYDTCRFCLQNEINALTAENNLLRSQRDACDRNSVIEECAKVCAGIGQDWPAMSDTPHPEYIAKKLRALKSQPASPDPRDEALRLAREALSLVKRDAKHCIPSYAFGDNEAACAMDRLLENIEGYGDQALAAIDKVLKEGK